MALGVAAAASTCFAASYSRCRIRAQATSSWAGNAEELVRSGTVRPVRPRDARELLGAEGFRLLDVRPDWERARAGVRGSVHVPLFVGDDDMSPVTLLKKWVHFGYIGLWTAQSFTKMNDRFLDDVAAGEGKDAKLLVACGEGLRYFYSIRRSDEGARPALFWFVCVLSQS
jgi:rhodanese-related sulfurtransferase